jgi:hypothetical protein
VVLEVHDATDESLNHGGHEVSLRLLAQSISFVYLRALGGCRFPKQHRY